MECQSILFAKLLADGLEGGVNEKADVANGEMRDAADFLVTARIRRFPEVGARGQCEAG